jgi:hypothetical protein
MVAEGKTIKAIAAARRVRPEAVAAEVDAVFVKLAQGVIARKRRARCGGSASCTRPSSTGRAGRNAVPAAAERPGHQAAASGRDIGETERVVVTVLMSDIRSYSAIAEHADPSQLAGQLNTPSAPR